MLKKFYVFLLSLLILNTFISISASSYNIISSKSNQLIYPKNENSSYKKETYTQKRSRFWTEENLKFLNEKEKDELFFLQDKVKMGENLSKDERRRMWALKDIVIKSKLGEEKYNDFKKLLLKKKSSDKLTDTELSRLKSYFKEIKGD